MIIPHKFIVGYTLIALCVISRIYWPVAGAVKQCYHGLKLNLTINVFLCLRLCPCRDYENDSDCDGYILSTS